MTVRRVPAIPRGVKITKTRNGLRLTQHGVVISELRITAGPTHSIFDVLSVLITLLNPPGGRVGLLGFAGGGMLAPLVALGNDTTIEAVDLDRASYALFRKHCPTWRNRVQWAHSDALAWLKKQGAPFDLLVEDLSIPQEGSVGKPVISWRELPLMIRRRLKPGGVAVFNLLPPSPGRWNPELKRLAGLYPSALLIHLQEFENRILVGGNSLPSARELGNAARTALERIGSQQAGRLRFEQLPGRGLRSLLHH